MTLPRKNYFATKALLLLTLLVLGTAAFAETAGTVTHLSGPLLARKIDGTSKILSLKSVVENGDLLVSEKDTYARIKFVDSSEITLRPNTQLKIENFSYDEAKPEKDNAFFSLIKGGLRSITGLLGKRSNDRFALKTPSATIGIRGTIFIAEYLPPTDSQVTAQVTTYLAASLAALDESLLDRIYPNAPRSDAPRSFLPMGVLRPLQLAQATSPGSDGRNPGLYVQVLDGIIHVSNSGGTQNFAAGQFGYTPSFQQPPVILPTNPGMKFSPPPSFSSNTGPQGGNSGGKPGAVDCEVR